MTAKVDSLPPMQGPPYQDDQGRWYTNQLFYERRVISSTNFRYKPIFTLQRKRPGYMSARETFIAVGDPTGYLWALKYLGDYQHFERLLSTSWFKEELESWRDELFIKMKSEAIQNICNIALEATSESQRLAAAKYLAEKGWEKEDRRGRPSKEEVKGKLKEAVDMSNATREEFERVGLKVINGHKGKAKGSEEV